MNCVLTIIVPTICCVKNKNHSCTRIFLVTFYKQLIPSLCTEKPDFNMSYQQDMHNTLKTPKLRPPKRMSFHKIKNHSTYTVEWFLFFLSAYFYTLKRKSTTSPSLITYSLPSWRTKPASLALVMLPEAIKSS